MNKPQPTSLRRQLLLHLTIPLLVVLALGAIGGIIIARQVGHEVHDQWILDSALTLSSQVRSNDGRVTLELAPASVQMFEWDGYDHIYWEASSTRQGRLASNAVLPSPPERLTIGQPLFYDTELDGEAVRVVAIEKRAPGNAADTVRIQVAETKHKRALVASKIFSRWTPLQIAVMVLAGAFIWLAVTRTLRKVDSVAARLGAYETDRLQPIADAEQMPTEIAPLISAINRLLAKLSAEQDTQKRFIANAAHQLRTPLATLQVQTHRVLRERDPLKHDQALGDVHRAVTRLHHVTQQLLTLMRSEQQSEKHLKLAPLDLAPLAREEVERWADAALAKEIDLGYEGPEHGITVNGDASLLRELMGNLIDNAIRYNSHGGTVTLTLDSAPLRIQVDDDGPGIPVHERELVLERFYRGSSSEQASGCGLGLSIAYEIAARHGARLSIEPGQPGTRICITFE
ncbi:sensor histidine kinase [Duganella sp. FT80W]|uniref:histidine kinase n=1 Tax=Duganella guangzhouensis TaxID=2666084 RepID=A0A6I2L8R4_9BURK|nr:sensor histidine kinase [Duganella guangzhouensis]MRW93607.1 sensor histidine kinase [Duganella guangzhouensis]